MKHILEISLMLLLLGGAVTAQRKKSATDSRQQTSDAELIKLRDDYSSATKEYKASLEKLLSLYQESETRAEQRYANSQKLLSEKLISQTDLDQSANAVSAAQGKIDEVRRQIADADFQLAHVPTIAELAREQKRASAHQPNCRSWTLTAYRRETKQTTTVAVKLVCRH